MTSFKHRLHRRNARKAARKKAAKARIAKKAPRH